MSSFIGLMRRAKNIRRWNLMSQFQSEDVATHSYEVALVAHMLGVIGKHIYEKDLNPEHMACLGLFHESSETLIGDVLTPVKYANDNIREAFKNLEFHIEQSLVEMIPEGLNSAYQDLVIQEKESKEAKLVKAADEICAYVKAKEEVEKGNTDFKTALANKKIVLDALCNEHQEVAFFNSKFLKGMIQSFDE